MESSLISPRRSKGSVQTAGFRRALGRPTPAGPSAGSASQRIAEFGEGADSIESTGRLGRDAAVRPTKNGRVAANFSVAVDESYKDLLGEWHKKTEWHRVQVWEELRKRLVRIYRGVCECTSRGAAPSRNWTDRENRKHAYREIVASEVGYLHAAPKREARNSGEFITDSSAELP